MESNAKIHDAQVFRTKPDKGGEVDKGWERVGVGWVQRGAKIFRATHIKKIQSTNPINYEISAKFRSVPTPYPPLTHLPPQRSPSLVQHRQYHPRDPDTHHVQPHHPQSVFAHVRRSSGQCVCPPHRDAFSCGEEEHHRC